MPYTDSLTQHVLFDTLHLHTPISHVQQVNRGWLCVGVDMPVCS